MEYASHVRAVLTVALTLETVVCEYLDLGGRDEKLVKYSELLKNYKLDLNNLGYVRRLNMSALEYIKNY